MVVVSDYLNFERTGKHRGYIDNDLMASPPGEQAQECHNQAQIFTMLLDINKLELVGELLQSRYSLQPATPLLPKKQSRTGTPTIKVDVVGRRQGSWAPEESDSRK